VQLKHTGPKWHLLGEENPVSFTRRVDTDVVLGVSRVRRKRLEDESVQGTSGRFDLDWLAGLGLDPSASLLPFLVEAKKSGFSTSLNELIGLADKLFGENPFWKSLTRLDWGGQLLGDRVPV
jgi:hypothetical protein